MLIRKVASFWTAVIVIVSALVGFEIWADSYYSVEAVKGKDRYSLIAHEKDDHGNLMSEALRLTHKDNENFVYLIGGSTLREGLLPDAALQKKYSTDTEKTFKTFYSFDQTVAETARLALFLNYNKGDIVVIDVNPRRMSFGPKTLNSQYSESRFSLIPRSSLRPLTEMLATRWPKVKAKSGYTPNFIKHRLYIREWISGRLPSTTKKAWGNVMKGHFRSVNISHLADFRFRNVQSFFRYAYGSDPLPMDKKLSIAQTVATKRVDDYQLNHLFSFDLLTSLIESLQAEGAEVVLLDLPRSDLSMKAYGSIWDNYDDNMATLVSDTSVRRIDLRTMPFSNDDFYDLEHLLRPKRAELSDMVVRSVIVDGAQK